MNVIVNQLRANDIQFKIPHIRTTSFMESFLPSTVKQWNILPEYITNASGISSFKSLLKSYFCKKGNELFHFGKRKYNILHCQLRNSASNLMADLYNQCLSDTPMCEHCIDSVADAHHYFFTCPKYTNVRDVLCQTIQNILDCDHIFDLDLLLYGSPDH